NIGDVFDHSLQARRSGAATVDMQGAAVHQDHVEDEVPTKRVVPGEEVDGNCIGADKRPELSDAHLVRGLHAVGDFHTLGQVGRARGELDLGQRLWADGGKARLPRLAQVL